MSKLSRQDLVNITHKYYANDGETGYNGYGCVYFKGDNGRCAIGVVLDHLGIDREELIEDYEEDGEKDHNEDGAADDIIAFLGERLTDHLEPDTYAGEAEEMFVIRLQKTHDTAASRGKIMSRLSKDVAEAIAKFAKEESLTVPE